MRRLSAIFLALLLILSLNVQTWAAADKITTTATGYTKAEDVEHEIVNGIVVNWGARGETCSFLSPSAQNYYCARDTETWEALSEKDGSTGTSDAYTSELYKALQSLMQTRHTKQTSYGETRYLFCYTDCLQNDYAHISSFYSGKTISGTWDQGATWNREHTWPSSKTPSGKPKNGTVSEATDIMTLRPTAVSENSNRGNTAFGESSGYFDPGESVRGDCARIVLYVYTRWGNTSKMWGSDGVIENLDVLLKWMEEDPVDTWEMGRNDSVQSITGVRNVFVDYPEFAWMLFGQEVPKNMVTPSGNATVSHAHSYTSSVTTAATCTAEGVLTFTCTCGDSYTETIPATDHSHKAVITAPTCTDQGFTTYTCVCGDSYAADYIAAAGHSYGDWYEANAATCTKDGQQRRDCSNCSSFETLAIAAIGHTWDAGVITKEPTETEPGEKLFTCVNCSQTKTDSIAELGHGHNYTATVTAPTCAETGSTTYTCTCGEQYTGDVVDALGHNYEAILTAPTCTQQGYTTHTCTVCGDTRVDTYTTALGHSDDDQNWNCDRCQLMLCDHAATELRDNAAPTCAAEGHTGNTYCSQCGKLMAEGTALPATGHQNTEIRNHAEATCGKAGYTGDTYCTDCGELVTGGSVIPATDHQNTELRNQLDATCGKAGHTGDTYCTDCGELMAGGSVIPATGEHKFSDWTSNENLGCRTCTVCGYEEVEYFEPTSDPTQNNWWPVVIAAIAVIVAGSGIAIVVIKKKKK